MLLSILYFPATSFICIMYFTLLMLFACLILFSASTLFSVLSLVMVFILTSILFIYIGVEYLGLIYIIVYVGAIAILFLFVLMLLNLRVFLLNFEDLFLKNLILWAVVVNVESLTFVYEFYPFFKFYMYPEYLYSAELVLSSFVNAFNFSIFGISTLLFNVYSIYIILCAFILLFIMIGVILLVNVTTPPTTIPLTLAQRNKILQDYLKSLRIARTNYDFSRK
jgi:NADH:ubiquinone oxidoreductase subunit 6 (subunit J)